MNNECEQLDAYFAGGLRAADLQRFEHHLLTCDSCGDAIREQHWIDELLQSRIRSQFEPTPDRLTSLSQARAGERNRRIQLVACGLAASLLFAVGLITFTIRHNENTGASTTIQSTGETVALTSSNSKAPSATFVADENAITLSVQSNAPEVTIVEVYPTLETKRRWHRELVLQNTLSKSNGG
jgi:hypothetical protein